MKGGGMVCVGCVWGKGGNFMRMVSRSMGQVTRS